jgi:hypothetical protein
MDTVGTFEMAKALAKVSMLYQLTKIIYLWGEDTMWPAQAVQKLVMFVHGWVKGSEHVGQFMLSLLKLFISLPCYESSGNL